MANINIKVKPLEVPDFITLELPPVKRQDGFTESPKIKLGELSNEQLEGLAKEWKAALLAKAKTKRDSKR